MGTGDSSVFDNGSGVSRGNTIRKYQYESEVGMRVGRNEERW